MVQPYKLHGSTMVTPSPNVTLTCPDWYFLGSAMGGSINDQPPRRTLGRHEFMGMVKVCTSSPTLTRTSMRSARLDTTRASTAGTSPRAGSSTHAKVVVPGI